MCQIRFHEVGVTWRCCLDQYVLALGVNVAEFVRKAGRQVGLGGTVIQHAQHYCHVALAAQCLSQLQALNLDRWVAVVLRPVWPRNQNPWVLHANPVFDAGVTTLTCEGLGIRNAPGLCVKAWRHLTKSKAHAHAAPQYLMFNLIWPCRRSRRKTTPGVFGKRPFEHGLGKQCGAIDCGR
jgi:hypothetical protein